MVMNIMFQERMLNDRKIAGTVGFCSNATITRNPPVLTTHATLTTKFVQNENSSLESSLPIPNPGNQECSLIEPKKPEGEQARGINESYLKVSSAFTPLAKVPKSNETKKDSNGASNASVVDQNKKEVMDEAKKMSTEDCNRTEPQRPVNPFAKSSSSKEQSPSLLDSIKRMKVETEKVEKPSSKVKV
jgi:chromosome transmission fidelity protein 4